MTDFTPTHMTTSAVRLIKACTPIKVARYTDGMMWSVLSDLGYDNDEEIGVRYLSTGDAEIHYDGDVLHVLRDDYVITDGETFAAVSNDTGWVPHHWEPAPANATVGDLGANDLYSTKIELNYQNSSIHGTVTDLSYDHTISTLAGPNWEVTVTVGDITVDALPRDTPCRLIRTNTA